MRKGFSPEDSLMPKSGYRTKVDLIMRQVGVQFGVTFEDHEHRLMYHDKDKTNER